MQKDVKNTVDNIVNELAKDKRITNFYAEWNNINRQKLSIYHDKPDPDIPLEDNKEFRSIKNAIINKEDVVKAYVAGKGMKEFDLKLGRLTDDERDIIVKGCLINYYRSQMQA